MKKFTLILAIAACSAMMATAQEFFRPVKHLYSTSEFTARTFSKANSVRKAELPAQSGIISNTQLAKNIAARKAGTRASADFDALYYIPYGALFSGMDPEKGWFSVPIFYTPGVIDQSFPNYSAFPEGFGTPKFTWLNGYYYLEQGTENAYETEPEHFSGIANLLGQGYGPLLRMELVGEVSEYMLGQENVNPDLKLSLWNAGGDDFEYMSAANCGIEDEYGMNGPYASFTDLTMQTNSDFRGNGNVVGFGQYIEAFTDVTTVESVLLPLTNAATKFLTNTPLQGKTLYCTICPILQDGTIGEPIATAEATDDEVIKLGDQIICVNFTFMEEDPIFGASPAPIVLQPNIDYMVVIDGFEQIKDNFMALFAGSLGFQGHAYLVMDNGNISTLGYSSQPSTPQMDWCLSLKAVQPAAVPVDFMPQALEFYEEGGLPPVYEDNGNWYGTYYVYTLSDIEKWDIETPDWISYEMHNGELNYGVMGFSFNADPLPASEEGREGVIKLSLMGKTVTIPVYQGVTAGIENVSAAKKSTKFAYNLLGQRVTKSNGIVLKDGKKYLVK